MAKFTIAHMYPDLMNLYGDRGNLLCLLQRLNWYGHEGIIKKVGLGNKIAYEQIDMVFMGGGSDREQGLFYQDLLGKADNLKQEIDRGLPVLCICGSYQLLGKNYRCNDGTVMAGLGFFDFYTSSEKGRLIGNVVIETAIENEPVTVVGFENHGGRTYFGDPHLKPFGRVIKGYGNNGKDGKEGMAYQNLIGTYLHGPLLPKNPAIADFYIKTMAKRRGVNIDGQLNDTIENLAHEQAKKQVMG